MLIIYNIFILYKSLYMCNLSKLFIIILFIYLLFTSRYINNNQLGNNNSKLIIICVFLFIIYNLNSSKEHYSGILDEIAVAQWTQPNSIIPINEIKF